MDFLNDFFSNLSGILWGWPMIILLLGTHLFLTIRLRFPQRKMWTAIKLSVRKDKGAEGDVSQFAALATALAATIGTGNIIGVATAISLGGPGAVLWCWLTGVFGISTKYAEGLLSIKYRVKTSDGKMLGGPMYALERGLGWKWLAVLFAIFRPRLIRHWQHRPSQRYRHNSQGHLLYNALPHWHRGLWSYRRRGVGWCEEHRKGM